MHTGVVVREWYASMAVQVLWPISPGTSEWSLTAYDPLAIVRVAHHIQRLRWHPGAESGSAIEMEAAVRARHGGFLVSEESYSRYPCNQLLRIDSFRSDRVQWRELVEPTRRAADDHVGNGLLRACFGAARPNLAMRGHSYRNRRLQFGGNMECRRGCRRQRNRWNHFDSRRLHRARRGARNEPGYRDGDEH